MENTQEILLNKYVNKQSTNVNVSLNVNLSGNRKLLPEDAINGTINAYDVYINERNKSNKFRLIFSINPYCSNVLFNPFTEIVKDEGGEDVKCLNYLSGSTGIDLGCYYLDYNDNKIVYTIGKTNTFKWDQYAAIRDTQLSNDKCGFDYHCGIDIFNNHLLRSKTFKTVNYDENITKIPLGTLERVYGNSYKNVKVNENKASHRYFIEKDFNTIDDYMRDSKGVIISSEYNFIVGIILVIESVLKTSELKAITLPNHLYQDYDVLSFEKCIETKLVDKDGWYGFYNSSNFDTKTKKDDTYSFMGINKVINNRNYCDFIDMYPGRDLFSFTPIYNKKRKRLEKNWLYFITYPSKSVIRNGQTETKDGKDFPFFRYDKDDNVSLKVYMFDEYTVNDDGINVLTIYSICQHGLRVGDYVNIYKGDDLAYDAVEVIEVVDKYIFQVVKDTGNLSEEWVNFKKRTKTNDIPNDEKIVDENGQKILPQTLYDGIFELGQNSYYPICESNRCNIDSEAQDIHFRRVVNNVECKYYVRKFSRLPNFKFKDGEVNDYTLYGSDKTINGETLIERFSKPGTDFESHISKLGFANTSYGDDTVEIVFTDDIDTSYLKDNLGRPLSDLYLTIIKNNKGYKEWYGIDSETNSNKPDTDSINVEFSHCFGKINGSFVLSDYFRELYAVNKKLSSLYDVRDLTARQANSTLEEDVKGLITATDNVTSKNEQDVDEIKADKDYEYYGDICCYSPVDCIEESIQNAMCRFNTVQRELSYYDNAKSYKYFNEGTLYHDEINDCENNLSLEKLRRVTRVGDEPTYDPYNAYISGSTYPEPKSETEKEPYFTYLYHTTREEKNNVLNLKEGYYYQPHYRIPIKLVSKELKTDNATKFNLVAIKKDEKINNVNQLFLMKTSIDNYFEKNEKLVLYRPSLNVFYYATVYDLLSPTNFRCVLNNENGKMINDIDGINDIDDFILLKKHESVPDYAKIIKDGSCRFYWREIVPNILENGGVNYPFTNGAFYITKQINFYVRRQGKEIYRDTYNTEYEPKFDYSPPEESVLDYPNFNPIDKTSYEPNQIEEC